MQGATGNVTRSPSELFKSARSTLNAREVLAQSQKVSTITEAIGLGVAICILILIYAVLLGISIYEIYLWNTYHNEPCEQKLPLFLGISGMSSLILGFVQQAISQFCPGEKSGDDKNGKWENVFSYCLQAYGFCLAVWGSVMVFGMNYHHHICPDPVFYFTYFELLILWSLGAITGICACFCYCAVICSDL